MARTWNSFEKRQQKKNFQTDSVFLLAAQVPVSALWLTEEHFCEILKAPAPRRSEEGWASFSADALSRKGRRGRAATVCRSSHLLQQEFKTARSSPISLVCSEPCQTAKMGLPSQRWVAEVKITGQGYNPRVNRRRIILYLLFKTPFFKLYISLHGNSKHGGGVAMFLQRKTHPFSFKLLLLIWPGEVKK